MEEKQLDNKVKGWKATREGDNLEFLIDGLEGVIKDGESTNIGVIGPYGSGKSSFIETFLNKKNYKNSTIRVSLASFNRKTNDNPPKTNDNPPKTKDDTLETNDNPPKTNPEFNESLQVGIVQQILYSFESNKIPLSRFKRIDTQSNSKIKFIILYYVTIIIFLLYIIFQNNIVFQFLPKFIFSNILYNYIHLILFFLIIPSYIIWTIYEAIIKSRKLSVSTGIGALSLEKSNTYILDKYLDEILYVFDANPDKKILVLEDMDRFDETILISMLTKLREINHILNNRDKKENGPVIFIYAIKEELITKPEDRVKFFDFIIPIIPYTDKNNSKSRLLKKFSQDPQILVNLLDILSNYIYDTRLMQHLYNEYQFYLNILKKESFAEFNPNKLLAIIAYKNLYPKDFSDLQKHSGIIYDNIKLGRNSSSLTFSQNISSLKEEILASSDKTRGNFIFSLLECDYIMDDYPNYISYFVDGHISASDREFIDIIKNNSNIDKTLWARPLDNPNSIISDDKLLDIHYFDKLSILNYDLFFTLINTNWEPTDQTFNEGKHDNILNILKGQNPNTYIDNDQKKLIQEFINGLLGPNGIQKYLNPDPLYNLIIHQDLKDLKFSDIPENTPLKLVQLIYENQYYIPSIEILTKCYNLSPKTITDMYMYYYHVQKCIAEKQLPEEDLNTALNNIVSNINTSIPEIDISPEDVTKVEFIKQILLNPKLQNSKKLIDALKSKNIPLEFDDSHIEQLKNLPFDKIKLLIENDMIAVALFASISTDNKNLSEDEKIMLWNIYIKKNKELVQNELTTPVLDTIFPRWKLFQGGYFKLNNTQDNILFCKFLKDKEYISKCLNLSDPKIKITNKKNI